MLPLLNSNHLLQPILSILLHLVVSDQQRIDEPIVNKKNEIQNKFNSKPSHIMLQKNQAISVTQAQPNVVTAATSSSFITAGGIVGVGKTQDDLRHLTMQSQELHPPPYHTKSSIDAHSTHGRQPTSVYGKAASLVSATMKISSATTEIYQRNGQTAAGNEIHQPNKVSTNGGRGIDFGNIDTVADTATKKNSQTQVGFYIHALSFVAIKIGLFFDTLLIFESS